MFLEALKQWFSQKKEAKQALENIPFVVIDLETTGLDFKKDKILSWAAIPGVGNTLKIGSAVYQTVNQEHFYKPTTAKIHGLLNEEGVNSAQESLTVLYNLLQNKVIIGHHIGFDIQFLKTSFTALGLKNFSPKSIDTVKLALKIDHGLSVDYSQIKLQEYSLENLCKRYHIALEDAHTAYGDTFSTALLYLTLTQICREKNISVLG
ncbi:MAG: 3'-5' exonuclease [Luteibaculaceae bacterium]